jgi:hypothetical protein
VGACLREDVRMWRKSWRHFGGRMQVTWIWVALVWAVLGTVEAQTAFPSGVAVMHVDFSVSTGITLDSGTISSMKMAQDTYNYASNRVRKAEAAGEGGCAVSSAAVSCTRGRRGRRGETAFLLPRGGDVGGD